MPQGTASSPGVLMLHSTGSGGADRVVSEDAAAYAERGYVAVCPDMVMHGERAGRRGKDAYFEALVAAYVEGGVGASGRPYVFDMAYECLGLVDLMCSGELGGIDAERVGISGVSLGGTVAWLTAAAEPRIACCIPIIGVQSYGYALRHGAWRGRVESLPADLFEAARLKLGRDAVDARAVGDVWDVLAPGLASDLDAEHTLGLVAPRPMLVLNGAEDPRCPIEGVELAMGCAGEAYAELGVPENLALSVEAGVGHAKTRKMTAAANAWMDRHLISPVRIDIRNTQWHDGAV